MWIKASPYLVATTLYVRQTYTHGFVNWTSLLNNLMTLCNGKELLLGYTAEIYWLLMLLQMKEFLNRIISIARKHILSYCTQSAYAPMQ